MTQVHFTHLEQAALSDAGITVFAGRLVLEAQPPVDDATLSAIAQRCAGPLPEPLIALWRNTFGGRLDYDLRAEVNGDDVPVSFSELFYPASDGYHDLWGWIDHERDLAEEDQLEGNGQLIYLPIGGFEYLERVYLNTEAGPDHGSVVYWRQGLPPGWELNSEDRVGRLAGSLPSLFGQLMLEQNPWEAADLDAGATMRDTIDELADSSEPHSRSAAAKLRDLALATVLNWREAVERATISTQPRLRRLALDRAAASDDVVMLTRLTALGCDPGEQVRNGLTPIDVAILHRSFGAVHWLLQQGVSVENSLRAGAHAVDLDLAHELLRRGASINRYAVMRAVDNDDIEVVHLLSQGMQLDKVNDGMGLRLSMLSNQADIASTRAAASGDSVTSARQRRRSAVLADLANRFDPGRHR